MIFSQHYASIFITLIHNHTSLPQSSSNIKQRTHSATLCQSKPTIDQRTTTTSLSRASVKLRAETASKVHRPNTSRLKQATAAISVSRDTIQASRRDSLQPLQPLSSSIFLL